MGGGPGGGGPGGGGPGSSAPQTPLPSEPIDPMMAPAAGRFSQGRPSGGGSRGRRPAANRYVDTFNPGGGDGADAGGGGGMPAPAARPKPPAYKVFTPQRPADAESEAPAPGSATPLFMTPTAEVYSSLQGGDEGNQGPPDADAQ